LQVCKADTRLLNCDFFFNENRTDLIATDYITVVAETYEINFELNSDIIDFKEIPVSSTKTESFVIKNLGPYGIDYK
jgi:hypothetical protein